VVAGLEGELSTNTQASTAQQEMELVAFLYGDIRWHHEHEDFWKVCFSLATMPLLIEAFHGQIRADIVTNLAARVNTGRSSSNQSDKMMKLPGVLRQASTTRILQTGATVLASTFQRSD